MKCLKRFARPHIVAAVLLCAAGLTLSAQGLWMHAKAQLAQVLLEQAFSETIKTGANVKPWSWADTWPIARIEVPRLQANAIVLHGSSGQALAFGPGHVETTPHAGGNGTAVYSAHRDTHFRFLKDVVAGDEIRVTLGTGKTLSLSRVGHVGRALGSIGHRSVCRWPQSHSRHLLAAGRDLPRPDALSGPCGADGREPASFHGFSLMLSTGTGNSA